MEVMCVGRGKSSTSKLGMFYIRADDSTKNTSVESTTELLYELVVQCVSWMGKDTNVSLLQSV